MTALRSAREDELKQIYEVFYQNEVLNDPQPPLPGEPPSYLRHVLQTGTIHVAEQGGEICGYAGAITRGAVTFLTDLFVKPTNQSGQIGKTLLHSVLLQDDLIHCTLSSSDSRALALYIRAGMSPQWPCFLLHLEKTAHEWSTIPGIEIAEANAHDLELLSWDCQLSGRLRPYDLDYWVRQQRAVPLWFRRHGQIVGYGYVRLNAGTLWHPQACTIGPLGVRNPEDAAACTLASVNWALQRAERLYIDVPGPHPCLAQLLDPHPHIKRLRQGRVFTYHVITAVLIALSSIRTMSAPTTICSAL